MKSGRRVKGAQHAAVRRADWVTARDCAARSYACPGLARVVSQRILGGDVGQYIQIGVVNTWYDESGSGDPLVLLHGGICTNETWGAQMPVFGERFRVIAPERRAHGHTADVPGPLTYDDMAADTIGFMERVVRQPAHLVGWSDGGIVGLLVAIARPDLVNKLVAIGTNYDAAGLATGAEEMLAHMTPDAPELEIFRNLYAMHSPDGPEHWPVVLGKFMEMARAANRTSPSTISLGSWHRRWCSSGTTTSSRSSTRSRCTGRSLGRSWQSCQERRTPSSWRSPTS